MGFAVVWSRQEQHWLSSSFPVTFKFRTMLAPREPPYYAGRERSGRRPYFKFSPPENWKLGKLGMEKEGETGNFASSYFSLSHECPGFNCKFFPSLSSSSGEQKKCCSLIPPSFLALSVKRRNCPSYSTVWVLLYCTRQEGRLKSRRKVWLSPTFNAFLEKLLDHGF